MVQLGDKIPSLFKDQSQLLENHYTLIIWLRHFGCRFFQESKMMIPNMKKELEKNQVNIMCVVQGDEGEIKLFWPFSNITCIPDPEKQSYKAMGFERTSLLKILFPNKNLKARRIEVKAMGCSMNKAGTKSKSSDILQLPGAALVDRQQKILWLHRAKDTSDLDLGEKTIQKIKDIIDKN